MGEPTKSELIKAAVQAIRTELQSTMGGVPEGVEVELKKIETILQPAN